MPASDSKISLSFLEEFLYTKLKGNGFTIDVDDYIVAAQIEQQIADDTVSIEAVKFSLAAIICRNGEEQTRFYEMFDTFISEKEKELEAKKNIAQKILKNKEIEDETRKKRVIFTVIFIFCLLAFIFSFCIPAFKTASVGSKELSLIFVPTTKLSHLTTSTSIEYSLLDSLWSNDKIAAHQTLYQKIVNPKFDTVGLKVNWNLQDTTIQNKSRIAYTFKKAGNKKITVTIAGASEQLHNSILICDPSPEINYPDPIYLNTPAIFTAENIAGKPIIWNIQDSTITTKSDTLEYTFDSVGLYRVSCKYVDQQCPHLNIEGSNIRVTEKEKFSIRNQQSGNPINILVSEYTNLFYILLGILALLLLACAAIYMVPYLSQQFQKLLGKLFQKNKLTYLKDVSIPDFNGAKPPININFYNNNSFIKNNAVFTKLASDLKKKIESEQYTLSLRQTIQASIRNWGIFTPVLQNKNLKRNYLILIDKSYSKSPQINLFQFLVNHLSASQVELEVYYYFKNPVNVYKKYPDDTVSITYLKNRYYQSVLIVFGDGYNFLDAQFPEIYIPLKNEFSYWTARLLVTPTPSLDWSLNEKLLATFFHIVPADFIGLIGIFELLLKQSYNQKTINTTAYHSYKVKFTRFENIEALEKYIGDTAVFQWLAALAAYPKINFETILALGNALDEKIVTYENLLKICRIDWVQQSVFPTRIRLELLKKLLIDNEIKARETIIKLLNEGSETDTKSFSNNERTMQLIVNKFVLYAYHPTKYPDYQKEEKEFLQLYVDKNVRDIPLKVYLQGVDPDKKEEHWENTLQQKANKTDRLESYYNQKMGIVPDKIIRRMAKITLLGLPILSAILFVFFSILSFQNPDFPQLVSKTYNNPQREWNIMFLKDTCFMKFAPSKLVITQDSRTILDTSIRDLNTLRLQNFKTVNGKNLEFLFVSDGNGSITNNYRIDSSQSTLSITGDSCDSHTPIIFNPIIYIQYYPKSFNDSAQKFRDYLINKGYTNIDQSLDLKKPIPYANSVRYYYDKGEAENIAQLMSSYFKQRVNVQKIRGNPKKQIEIWIKGNNVANPDTVAIQYDNASQKTHATKLGTHLRQKGYIVQAITERETDIVNEIRYYSNTQKNNAENVRNEVKKIFPMTNFMMKSLQLSLPEKNKNIIKIWINYIADTPPLPQCLSRHINKNFIIYFENKKTTFSESSLQVLRELASELDKNENLTITVNSYSKYGGAKMSTQYGDAIQQHLNNTMVRLHKGTYKSYDNDNSDPKNTCTEKSIIIVHDFEVPTASPKQFKDRLKN